jgi:hypothetical protein
MKSIFTASKRIFLFIGFIIILQSGNQLFGQQLEYVNRPVQTRPFYFGFGLGVNDYGLGLNLEAPIAQNLSINGNVGIGGWGLKLGGSINLYSLNNHSEFSLGYSHASGIKDFHTELSVEPNGKEQSVNLDLNQVSTINLIYSYNIKVGRSSKIAFSGGYAICLTNEAYRIKDFVTLDTTSQLVIDMMQPGGLIFGVKLMIGGL